MCLAVPGRVMEIEKGSDPLMATVSFGGTQMKVCIDMVPDVIVGEYVIVHVGFALSKMDEEEAQKTLDILRQMGDLAER